VAGATCPDAHQLKNGDQRELKNLGFYVAESCDGQTDFDSFAFLPKHLGMLDLLIAQGIAEECQEGDAIEPWQRYRKADNPRLTGIHWCVTGRCDLKCRHCYMEAPSGRYGQLPFEAMAGLVEQFERANVLEVSLTGGEPFLRPDLLDIIQLLAQKKDPAQPDLFQRPAHDRPALEGIRRIGFRPASRSALTGWAPTTACGGKGKRTGRDRRHSAAARRRFSGGGRHRD